MRRCANLLSEVQTINPLTNIRRKVYNSHDSPTVAWSDLRRFACAVKVTRTDLKVYRSS